MIDGKLFQEPMATKLVNMRIQARNKVTAFGNKKILTYNCMNAIVKGASVVCKKKHRFKPIGRQKQGGLSLSTVLTGRSSSVCQKCKDYDGEENE